MSQLPNNILSLGLYFYLHEQLSCWPVSHTAALSQSPTTSVCLTPGKLPHFIHHLIDVTTVTTWLLPYALLGAFTLKPIICFVLQDFINGERKRVYYLFFTSVSLFISLLKSSILTLHDFLLFWTSLKQFEMFTSKPPLVLSCELDWLFASVSSCFHLRLHSH